MESKIRRGISGSTLKMIAIIAMFIDHVGAGVVGRYMSSTGMQVIAGTQWLNAHYGLYITYWIMRMIGRLGFPIFCFLLIEGFEHTRDVKKYALRLFAFCLISEVPFDLLFNGSVLEFGYQNVFFTLLIGLLTMCGFRMIDEQTWNTVAKGIGYVLVLLAGMAVADFLRTDYSWIGVLSIIVLYMFRKSKAGQIAAGCVVFLWELTAPLAFIPIGFYNGRRGWKMKYFFYLFYPVHLLLLYLVCMALGISGFAAV